MVEFMNVSLKPGYLTIKLKDGVCNYNVFGYVLKNDNGVAIQPADLRKNPVMEIPNESIESITCDYDI